MRLETLFRILISCLLVLLVFAACAPASTDEEGTPIPRETAEAKRGIPDFCSEGMRIEEIPSVGPFETDGYTEIRIIVLLPNEGCEVFVPQYCIVADESRGVTMECNPLVMPE